MLHHIIVHLPFTAGNRTLLENVGFLLSPAKDTTMQTTERSGFSASHIWSRGQTNLWSVSKNVLFLVTCVNADGT